ncbi:MAG TPA: hypothetical protein VKR38_18180 [Usitatibacter sp.]|nr:hypothetical protein [Usitatibacter sp.]
MAPYSRRFILWVCISLLVHIVLIAIPMKRKNDEAITMVTNGPLTVEIVNAGPPPSRAEEIAPKPTPAVAPEPVRRPIVPRPVPKELPKLVTPEPSPTQVPVPPQPEPAPPRPEPPVDMMAAIRARQEARRQAEAALARGPREPSDSDRADANINRNLHFTPGGGVGGVFQILNKGTRTAEFAFNGWQPDRDRRWREVIEVEAPLGGDIDRAVVRRMIQLIREHYTGEFRWESRRLGRVVTLDASPDQNDGLEDFLIQEFFGTPTLKGR